MNRRIASLMAALSCMALSLPRLVGGDGPPQVVASGKGDAGKAKAVTPESLAHQIWIMTDTILDHHIDPPARQTMLLGSLQALTIPGTKKAPLGPMNKSLLPFN